MYEEILHCNAPPSAVAKSLVKSGDLKVYVTPDVVMTVIAKYISGDVDQNTFIEWADFLITEDVYVPLGWDDDDDSLSDQYDDMWDILHEIAAPYVHGNITKNRVEEYMERLSGI